MSKNSLSAVTDKYAYKITNHVAQLSENSDAVARQYMPDTQELKTTPDELLDPIGDDAHSPVKGIVHRYPDRVLLKPVHACAVYCRFCFRREMVGPNKGFLSAEELDTALDYIRARPDIWEVILTGGDPLILSPRRLHALFEKLNAIDHVKIIRIHTRLPLVDPAKINDALCAALDSISAEKALYIALHVNHADELTDSVRAAIGALNNCKCTLISQSVLLKDINDNVQALSDLFRALVTLHVKPYYLHHPDKAPGTSHFRVSITKGQALMKELRGNLSGLCQPTYMLDIPQGFGKVPLTPCYIHGTNTENEYTVEDPHGTLHDYI